MPQLWARTGRTSATQGTAGIQGTTPSPGPLWAGGIQGGNDCRGTRPSLLL